MWAIPDVWWALKESGPDREGGIPPPNGWLCSVDEVNLGADERYRARWWWKRFFYEVSRNHSLPRRGSGGRRADGRKGTGLLQDFCRTFAGLCEWWYCCGTRNKKILGREVPRGQTRHGISDRRGVAWDILVGRAVMPWQTKKLN